MPTTSAIYYLPPEIEQASSPRPLSADVGPIDVWLFHMGDGGEIEIVNGEVTRGSGYETAAYLSLFGGNEDDSGLPADKSKQWWGNWSEPDPARAYRSETQYLLNTLPATTGNLRRLQPAAENDLAWLVDKGHAKSVSVAIGMPAINHVSYDVLIILANGDRLPLPQLHRAWGKKT